MRYQIYLDQYWVIWCKNGERNRLDGPAVEYLDGHKYYKYWFINDKNYSEEEFNKVIQLGKNEI